MVGRGGEGNIGYFSECLWCAQHWQKSITEQIQWGRTCTALFHGQRDVWHQEAWGPRSHSSPAWSSTHRGRGGFNSPLKGRPAEGRQESPHAFLYYILNYFQFFPIGLILFFYNKVLFFWREKKLLIENWEFTTEQKTLENKQTKPKTHSAQ